MNTEFFGNLFVLLIILYAVACLIEKYNALVFDKFRFRYFALRDRLAMLVIDGKLEEDSWEYREIVKAINFHIRAVESISLGKMASAMAEIAEFHSNPQTEKKYEAINRETEDPEIISVMIEFFETTRRLIYRNSKAQIRLLHLFSHAVNGGRPSSPEIDRVKISDTAIAHLKHQIEELRSPSAAECLSSAQRA